MSFLLLESGAPDNLLLESGDDLLLEVGSIGTYVTQAQRETWYGGEDEGDVRVTHLRREVWTSTEAEAWNTQIQREVWTSVVAPAWVTQIQREVWTSVLSPSWITHVQREIWWTAMPASCSGGVVPSVADPADGVEFSGLGPHQDRMFIEVDFD